MGYHTIFDSCPLPLKLRPYGAIEILLLVFLYPRYQGSRGVWKIMLLLFFAHQHKAVGKYYYYYYYYYKWYEHVWSQNCLLGPPKPKKNFHFQFPHGVIHRLSWKTFTILHWCCRSDVWLERKWRHVMCNMYKITSLASSVQKRNVQISQNLRFYWCKLEHNMHRVLSTVLRGMSRIFVIALMREPRCNCSAS